MSFRLPDRVGHVRDDSEDGPVLYLCPLPNGPATVLSGSGVAIWLSAIRRDEDIPESVARVFDVEVETIRADVENFLNYLVVHGLLEEVP